MRKIGSNLAAATLISVQAGISSIAVAIWLGHRVSSIKPTATIAAVPLWVGKVVFDLFSHYNQTREKSQQVSNATVAGSTLLATGITFAAVQMKYSSLPWLSTITCLAISTLFSLGTTTAYTKLHFSH